ncbi:transmembrane protein 216 [Trypanosoma conorhini]|uniref:Transmembrane protein 216 n=1 Tax=Trypanosoma conorhini TaxID=83891 RepID=A0A3R7KRE7_9TRYP|nr:transmembrane protein 216 [Trypanosoma conorhini]RNF12137.1 transmembrane protein 216 [Trypanosoma conorhini]
MNAGSSTVGGPSLSFQLLLYGSSGWSGIWFILTLALLIYKGTLLPFPPAALPMEIVSAFFLLVVDIAALSLGTRGNLTEEVGTSCLALGLLLVAAVGAVYYMWLQTYVMMLDLAFSAILLGLNILTVLAGVYALQGVVRAKRGPRQRFAAPPRCPPISPRGEMKRRKGD